MKHGPLMLICLALALFGAPWVMAAPLSPLLIDLSAFTPKYLGQTSAAGGGQEESAIMIVRPQPYEVIQRAEGAAEVSVRLAQPAPAACIAQVKCAGEAIVCERALSPGQSEVVLPGVPEGGWYTLVVSSGGKEVASVPFGVGDVFLVAGQSNAGGNGDGFIPDHSGMVSVKAWEQDLWLLATRRDERMHPEMQPGSAWPILGELLATARGVPIGFINVARGGSNTDQWLPANNDLYPRLPSALKQYQVSAILWHQGESDAASGWPTEKTRANMETIIRQSWQDAGWQVPWYVAFVSFIPGLEQEKMDATRLAQKQLCQEGLAYLGPDTDVYVDPDTMRHDHLHFNGVGLRVHAILWFMTLTWGAPGSG